MTWGASWMWRPRERVQDELRSFLAQAPLDMETPSREVGCGDRLEAGEFRCEQSGARRPVGHPGGQNARHRAGTRDHGDLQEEVSARGNSVHQQWGTVRRGTITERGECRRGIPCPFRPSASILDCTNAAGASGCLPPSACPHCLLPEPGHLSSASLPRLSQVPSSSLPLAVFNRALLFISLPNKLSTP